jgi:hypothetical protein
MDVRLQGFHLTAQSIPPAIFTNLKVLILEQVTVNNGVLAEMLSHCSQLEELQLLRTCLLGPSQPLSVLSKLSSLSLTLDVQETILPKDQQPLAFLQHLGACLTSLDVQVREHDEHHNVVLSYVSNHLHRLKHLTVSSFCRHRYDPQLLPSDVAASLAASPAGQQLETLTLNSLVLQDMECAVKLLCMPKLKLLAGNLYFPDEVYDTPASLNVPWPSSKPAMELQLGRAGVKQLAALPLERFTSINVSELDLGLTDEVSHEEREKSFQAFLAAAHRGPPVSFTSIGAQSGDGFAPLLPVLGTDCPIRLKDSSFLQCASVVLGELAVQEIAAQWGSQLKKLVLTGSDLDSSAWAAITPTAFPMLEELQYLSHQVLDWAPEVAVFCKEWPLDRKLLVKVTGSECCHNERRDGNAAGLAAQVQAMLTARGRHNITFTFGWDDDE